MNKFELKPEQLRAMTDVSEFSFKTTEELTALDQVIGQERALRAIDFGIEIPSYGYNIFVVGPAGSGRITAVRQFLDRRAEGWPVPADWCYVYNFKDERRPNALRLPAGRGIKLRDAMDDLIERLQQDIPRAFEGEYYEQRRREIQNQFQSRQQELVAELESYLNERGFALIRSQMGLGITPIVDGRPLGPEAFEKLDAETRKKLEAYRPELQEQFDKTMRRTRELDREARQAIENITSEMTGFVVDNAMDEIKEAFGDLEEVVQYLQDVREDVVQNSSDFMPEPEGQQIPFLAALRRPAAQPMNRYKVNVLAEPCDAKRTCAPVVIEDNPTYYNLIGRIEYRAEFGAMVTDFTQIRPGALHRANGGYIIIDAKQLLTNPNAYEGLKRALRNHQIKIEDMSQFYGLVATVSLEPEPIPLDVKVVLIGEEMIYQLLYAYDEDFRELFKVKAQFATEMPRNEENAQEFARLVAGLTQRENLHPFDAAAVARLYDEAATLVEDKDKITTRFGDVADLVRESSFWATRAGREVVTAEDVRKAVEEGIYRLRYRAERYQEMIDEGVILIDTQGAVVGQVNGLSVSQMANFEFGMPSRITAQTFLGKAGVVSIDREVKLSGPIHDKGQLILSAYLLARFAQRKTLSVSASLTFEQNYGGIEGDSASSTELYVLLSSLAGVPIKQNLAVTGAVSQLGHVQAIGGVNAKIAGFYDVCKLKGLTGDQGVLIPVSNVQHLMLREDIVDAVAQGKFHIYAVSTIEEGIELLTGIPAGTPDAAGNYPEGTLYAKVQQKLEQYSQYLREEAKEEEEEEQEAFPPEGGEEEDPGSGGDDDDNPEPEEDEAE